MWTLSVLLEGELRVWLSVPQTLIRWPTLLNCDARGLQSTATVSVLAADSTDARTGSVVVRWCLLVTSPPPDHRCKQHRCRWL